MLARPFARRALSVALTGSFVVCAACSGASEPSVMPSASRTSDRATPTRDPSRSATTDPRPWLRSVDCVPGSGGSRACAGCSLTTRGRAGTRPASAPASAANRDASDRRRGDDRSERARRSAGRARDACRSRRPQRYASRLCAPRRYSLEHACDQPSRCAAHSGRRARAGAESCQGRRKCRGQCGRSRRCHGASSCSWKRQRSPRSCAFGPPVPCQRRQGHLPGRVLAPVLRRCTEPR